MLGPEAWIPCNAGMPHVAKHPVWKALCKEGTYIRLQSLPGQKETVQVMEVTCILVMPALGIISGLLSESVSGVLWPSVLTLPKQ